MPFGQFREQAWSTNRSLSRSEGRIESTHNTRDSGAAAMKVFMFRKLKDPSENAVTVYVDGAPISAEVNENVATVLLRQPMVWSRTTPISETRRAPFCMMGVCFDCLALVDGALVQTCLAPVRDGMHVERQLGRRKVAP